MTAAKPAVSAQAFPIRELLTEEELLTIYPLLHQLNPDMSEEHFRRLLPEVRAKGSRCIGAYDGKKLVAIAGFRISARFWCGRYIDFDNVMVDDAYRNAGLGPRLVDWVEEEGRRQQCDNSLVEVYARSHGAHRFYFRQGYDMPGYLLVKPLCLNQDEWEDKLRKRGRL